MLCLFMDFRCLKLGDGVVWLNLCWSGIDRIVLKDYKPGLVES